MTRHPLREYVAWGIILVAAGIVAAAKAAVPQVRIARFADDRSAAISYTFDDNLRDQYTLAVPMLNDAGFKGTFFVIPGATAETPEQAKKKENEKRAWGSISWPELKGSVSSATGTRCLTSRWSSRKLPDVVANAL
jgi:peptidoglycan/xylan/chitin deacetylase (PgdA/CDA1 family)